MFGDNSLGFTNEKEIIDYLNSSMYFDNLNTNFKSFLSFLFNKNLTGKIIKAYKITGCVKPDILIVIDDINKYVSVKKGSGNSVHQEKLFEFESFLINNNISQIIIDYLKEFHYGDGSTDGNGGERIRASCWKLQNPQKVIMINRALNTEIILVKLLYRFLFIGNIKNAPVVDIIYHGNIDNGIWASRDEIISFLITNRNNSGTVHFSNLSYQVWNRCLNHNNNTENRRHIMQIKWQNLRNNFVEITNNRLSE